LKGKCFAILVLGVAGVGKTVFGRALAGNLGLRFVDVPEIVKSRRLYSEYDPRSQAYVVDLRKVSAAVGSELKEGGGVISSIYAFKPRGVEVKFALILRMKPTKLLEVLRRRGYPNEKLKENVSAELIDQPVIEAFRKFGEGRVIQLDVTDVILEDLAGRVAEAIMEKKLKRMNAEVDWISELEKSGELDDLLRFLESEDAR